MISQLEVRIVLKRVSVSICDVCCGRRWLDSTRNPCVKRILREFAEFQRDPKAWLDTNLNPRDYKATNLGGEFESRATLDWSKWLPIEK